MAVSLKHRTVTQEKIEFDNGPIYHSLGPELVLSGCDLMFEGSTASTIVAGLTMIGGSIQARRTSTNVQFERANFRGVRFSGQYVGCDFGNLSDAETGASNCDYSEALLNLCRFKDGNADTCVFGPWPTVVLLDPRNNAPKLEAVVPSTWHVLIKVMARTPLGWGAVVLNIGQLMKKHGGTEEELRSAFAKSFVLTSTAP